MREEGVKEGSHSWRTEVPFAEGCTKTEYRRKAALLLVCSLSPAVWLKSHVLSGTAESGVWFVWMRICFRVARYATETRWRGKYNSGREMMQAPSGCFVHSE